MRHPNRSGWYRNGGGRGTSHRSEVPRVPIAIPTGLTERRLTTRDHLAMEATAVMYVVAVATTAQFSGSRWFLFPALAAISDDVLTRPWGKWASQPGRLVVTPTLGAAIGTLITKQFPYHVLSVLLIVTACLGLLAILRSNIGPAIAAGMLPLVLGITSWLYPVAVMIGLVGVVVLLVPWHRHYQRKYPDQVEVATSDIDDRLEAPPVGNRWILPLYLFLATLACYGTVSGLRLLLVPPLVVIAYEMFANPDSCPWAQKPFTLPLACLLTATAGWLAVTAFGASGIAAGLSMATGIAVLRLLQIHMPPALAIGLLPLVISSAGIKYPICVAIGATALTFVFLLYRRWIATPGRATESISMR